MLLLHRNTTLSANVCILLRNLCFAQLLFSLSLLIVYGHLVHSIENVDDVKNLKSSLCFYRQIVMYTCALAINGFLCLIAIERIYATIFYKTYDETGRRCSIIITILLCMIVFALMFRPSRWSILASSTAYCTNANFVLSSTGSPWNLITPLIWILILIEILIALAFAWVAYRSKKLLAEFFINRAQLSLAQRLHLNHIIQGSKMMLRICTIQIVAYFIGISSLFLFASIKATHFANCYHFLIDIMFSKGIGNVYGILMPLACILSDKKLRKIFFGCLSKLLKYICPLCAKTACEETRYVSANLMEMPAKEEADQRISDLEATWQKAFEMRSLRK